jgi:hypothetical protein
MNQMPGGYNPIASLGAEGGKVGFGWFCPSVCLPSALMLCHLSLQGEHIEGGGDY